MAAHLLETPTIADRAWTDEPRLPRETRAAFIRRVLLGETDPVEAPESETAASETASGAARPRKTDFTESDVLARALPVCGDSKVYGRGAGYVTGACRG